MKGKIIINALGIGFFIGGPLLLLSILFPFIGIPLLLIFVIAWVIAVALTLSGHELKIFNRKGGKIIR